MTNVESAIDKLSAQLAQTLGENLKSLILYGSTARGDADPAESDINLLIALESSTAAAHKAIRDAISGEGKVEPMIVQRDGFARAQLAFALKFLSIGRNYRVLAGEDILANEPPVSQGMLRFLAEQEVRNLRMRLTNVFVTSHNEQRRYATYLRRNTTGIIVTLSDLLRAEAIDVPTGFAERFGLFQREFGADPWALNELLERRRGSRRTSPSYDELHAGLVALLSAAIHWMEARWREPQL